MARPKKNKVKTTETLDIRAANKRAKKAEKKRKLKIIAVEKRIRKTAEMGAKAEKKFAAVEKEYNAKQDKRKNRIQKLEAKLADLKGIKLVKGKAASKAATKSATKKAA